MRTLSWRHGRAWIAASPEDWPDTLQWPTPTAARRTVALAATGRGASAAAVVRRVCQTASGGSFFAQLGGRMTPSTGDVLEVTIAVVDDPDGEAVLPEIVAGLTAMPAEERPAGRLEVSWIAIHPVDYKPWAWRNAAATMARLLCADVSEMDDATVAALAQGYGVGRTVG
jgi:hypothetical protein